MKEGYQSRSVGTMETKRGTADATYLYYTLGKLEIMKLREDLKKKQGAAFNLQTFHNDFMRQGFAPIKIIRKAMLHDDSPVRQCICKTSYAPNSPMCYPACSSCPASISHNELHPRNP